MRRLPILRLALGASLFALGYLAGTRQDRPAPAPREQARTRDQHLALENLALQEENRRLRSERPSAGTPAAPPVVEAPESESEAPEPKHERIEQWKKALHSAVTSQERLQRLSEGNQVYTVDRDREAVIEVLREELARLDSASDEAAEARLQIGYVHRAAGDYAAADRSFIEAARNARYDSRYAAAAVYQHAWSRSMDHDPDAALRLFEETLASPAVTADLKAHSRYAIAHILLKKGERIRAKAEFEALIADNEPPSDGSVGYIVGLARKALESLG